jgi:hypothetical protein
VLLSEEIYQNLMIKQNNTPKKSAWELLLNKPFAGIRTKAASSLNAAKRNRGFIKAVRRIRR